MLVVQWRRPPHEECVSVVHPSPLLTCPVDASSYRRSGIKLLLFAEDAVRCCRVVLCGWPHVTAKSRIPECRWGSHRCWPCDFETDEVSRICLSFPSVKSTNLERGRQMESRHLAFICLLLRSCLFRYHGIRDCSQNLRALR